MKLTFLGTSHGVPGVNRFCSCTMIQSGGAVYLIDGGAPVGDLLIRYGIPFRDVRAIFVTHMHADHTMGFPGFLSLANWYYTDADFDMFLPQKEGVEILRRAIEVTDGEFHGSRLRLHTIGGEGVVYSDDNLTVTAIATCHCGETIPSYAFLIEGEGKRVIMTGDLAHDMHDFPEIARLAPSDLIVCEMAHFGPETAFPILQNCPTRRLLFHHVWHDYESSMAAIRAMDGKLAFPVRAVDDGDTLEL